MGIDDSILDFFLSFSWPGNVRQLKHCIEFAMNFVTEDAYYIKKEHLPQYIFEEKDVSDEEKTVAVVQSQPAKKSRNEEVQKPQIPRQERPSGDDTIKLKDIIREKEKEEIIEALMSSRGNVAQAAKKLNIGRQALVYRMKKYHIE